MQSDVVHLKVQEAKWQTADMKPPVALIVQWLPKGQEPPKAKNFDPTQKKFDLGSVSDGNPDHWIWRVEYRIKTRLSTWSPWCVWSCQPNSYIRKRDAERRLKKIKEKIEANSIYTRDLDFHFEFAVRPYCCGYDVREARRYAKKVKMVKALDKLWADKVEE